MYYLYKLLTYILSMVNISYILRIILYLLTYHYLFAVVKK